ncbi:PTS sugar transporter subunit IIA [Proteiniclasticum ruminis]|uniref:PTS system, mannose-specific IIA component n=1 Tax=Proteiniclasticum ruminis TaxID=398199 RepID=A0A1I5A202_9CLOT|nr:hypothetical protein [Proteiniclasticum ruminis]SFN56370.1 PTS system, mannose-specific IIA component [Proteiniclasticum ruminis]
MKKKIFIATHADLSEGFKNAAKLIVGSSADEITTFCLYEGQSAEDFKKQIKEYKEAHPSMDIIVLSDLFGASIFNAMVELHTMEDVYVVTGVNLGLVLDLLLEDRKINLELLKEKISTAQKGVLVLDHMEKDTGDEF